MFDHRVLRYVITVAEEGGFTAAARKLNIAQSAISRQVANLEEELGGALFLRRRQGLEMTEAGRRFVAHARDMLESMRNVRDDVSSLLVEPSGPVVIGVPPTAGVTLIPRIFATCREKWPNIQLAVRESYSADIYSGVLRNEIDIGLVHDPVVLPELYAMPLIGEPMYYIAPAGADLPDPVPADYLAGHPLILPEAPFGLRQLLDGYARAHGLNFTIAASVNGVSITKAMVADGIGATVLTRSAVVDEIEAGRLVANLLDPPLLWELCVLMRMDRAGNRSFNEVARIARSVVTDLHEEGIL
ncbi:MAG: LysR family transcriptional regulator [Rhodospirillales bacterium]